MANSAARIHPVILSGGAGTRLWPLSRRMRPKQFLALVEDEPMLVATARRVADPDRFAAPLLIAGQDHADLVADLADRLPVVPVCLALEPEGRNTAGAVALALRLVERLDPHGLALILPSDHAIGDSKGLGNAVDIAARAAADGHMMTFGIVPTAPETAYGYIECGAELDGIPDAFAVKRFVEKPDLPRARAYVAQGDFYWNSGMFLLPVRATLAAFERLAPAILAGVDAALAAAESKNRQLRFDPALFAAIPSEAFDRAIMEKTDAAGMVPSDFAWSDVGSWQSLWEVADKDAQDNASSGRVVAIDSRGCYLRSDDRLLVALGIDDLAVIDSGDAVAVFPLAQNQRVTEVVERLRAEGQGEADAPPAATPARTLLLPPGASRADLPPGEGETGYWYLTQGTVEVAFADARPDERMDDTAARPLAWSETADVRPLDDAPAHLLVFGQRSGNSC